MKKLFDLASVRLILRRGIDAGYWTLEDLDKPSQDWSYQKQQAKRIPGHTHPPFRNLLRDDFPIEAVQTINPRDFDVAAATRPNKGLPNLDLLPERWPDQPHLSDLSDRRDFSSDQDPAAARSDHGQTPHLGITREHHPSSVGALRQPSLEPGEYLDDPGEPDF